MARVSHAVSTVPRASRYCHFVANPAIPSAVCPNAFALRPDGPCSSSSCTSPARPLGLRPREEEYCRARCGVCIRASLNRCRGLIQSPAGTSDIEVGVRRNSRSDRLSRVGFRRTRAATPLLVTTQNSCRGEPLRDPTTCSSTTNPVRPMQQSGGLCPL